MQSNTGAEGTEKGNAEQEVVQTESVQKKDVLNIPAPQEVDTQPEKANMVESKEISETPPVTILTKEEMAKRVKEDEAFRKKLEAREKSANFGNPAARVADPAFVNVQPRYDIVQNRSENVIIVPDLKTHVEDMGLVLQPGEVAVLHDFYSPQEINRSRGLRWAATEMKGYGGNMGLTSLKSEDEGTNFKLPPKVKREPGTTFEDKQENPFDERFYELEERDAKREAKLIKKTLASRKQRMHGQVTHV